MRNRLPARDRQARRRQAARGHVRERAGVEIDIQPEADHGVLQARATEAAFAQHPGQLGFTVSVVDRALLCARPHAPANVDAKTLLTRP